MADRAHVELSPSRTKQWWECPGSIAAQRGKPDESSSFADEGTAAHALAERAWTAGKPAGAYYNTGFEVNGVHYIADAEMCDAVQVLLDVYASKAAGADRVWVEQWVGLDALKPPAPMGGTVDFGVWKDGWLEVVDFKYGRGVVVEAVNNPQGRSYAAGLWMRLIADNGAPAQPRGVRVTIVQPRAFHPDGPVRTEEIPLPQFKIWVRDLLKHAANALEPGAPRIAGDWCKFCKAKAECPEVRAAGLALFEVVPAGSVPALTGAEVARLLEAADRAEDVITAIRAKAFRDLEVDPASVPGYGLTPKRTHRQYRSPALVPLVLDALGVPEIECYEPPKVLTPAQMEKVAKRHGVVIPASCVVKPDGGMTLTRLDAAVPLAPRALGGEFTTVVQPEPVSL